jgi:hypothetical protein
LFTDHKVRKYKEYHNVCVDSPERKKGRKNEDRGQKKRGLRPEKNKKGKGKREGKRKKKGKGKKKTIESGCKLVKVRLTIGRESQ